MIKRLKMTEILTVNGVQYVESDMDTMDTRELINRWAKERNLIRGSTPAAQMVKLMEEAGELAHAIARGESVTDAIGDCAVVLSVLALQHDITLAECMEHAYQQIKDRKGVMVNGVFVKTGE